MAGQVVADPAWRRLYRAGGFSFLLGGILFVINLPLLLILGPTATSGEAALAGVAAQNLIFRIVNSIFIAFGFLAIPAVLALYFALKELDREYALLACGLLAAAIPIWLITIIVNISITGVNNASVAELILAIFRLGDIVSVLLLSIGALIVGLIMRRGVFSRWTAYLGVVNGVVGIIVIGSSIPVPGLGVFGLFSLALYAIWYLAVGVGLYKLR